MGTPEPGPPPPSERVAVVLPCFKVTQSILDVLARIGPECWRIYVVDDACPQGSGDLVESDCHDPRVRVLRNETNLGVGGAVLRGYEAALADGAAVIVKIDGDGQMAPEILPSFIRPILAGEADYTKGNRFHDLAKISRMPAARIFGNAILTFMAKLSAGYWDIFDPTNGYTAIHSEVARHLMRSRISQRFFFETDVLFRLSLDRAVVADVPMDSEYGNEVSNLRIWSILPEFLYKHMRNASKRVLYNYFLRDFSIASLELLAGASLLGFGVVYGAANWTSSYLASVARPPGTVMLAALPIVIGLQLLLAFVGFDIASTPKRPIHAALADRRRRPTRATRSASA